MGKISLIDEKKFIFLKRLEGNVAEISYKKQISTKMSQTSLGSHLWNISILYHLDANETHLPIAGA